jgi:hypothetical protein
VAVYSVERKLAAIFAADIAGYSRLMARDEGGTLARLKACRNGSLEDVFELQDEIAVSVVGVTEPALQAAAEMRRSAARPTIDLTAYALYLRALALIGPARLDAGDHLGNAPCDLDQTKADRVELGITPERCPGRQPAQGEHQPMWTSGNRGSRIEAQIVDSAAIRALSPGGLRHWRFRCRTMSGWTCRRRRRRFALWTSKAGGSGEAHASLTPEQSQHAC